VRAGRAGPWGRSDWEGVAADESPSWYLDPLVADQKRDMHLALLERFASGAPRGTLLKTDLFEEANGSDELLGSCRHYGLVIGMDLSRGEVARARRRHGSAADFVVTDVRRLGLASDSVDVVFSNSTLDHFASQGELGDALAEVARVLRPGGVAIVTLDNPRNPTYWLLRLAARLGESPYPLGATRSLPRLVESLEREGLEVTATEHLIHNPRGLSTLLFLVLRRLLGRRADRGVRGLLAAFALLDRLPTRGLTSCFVAVRARKPPLTGASAPGGGSGAATRGAR